MTAEQIDRSALILRYVSIRAEELRLLADPEKNKSQLETIASEKFELARSLGMTSEEILLEAKKRLPSLG